MLCILVNQVPINNSNSAPVQSAKYILKTKRVQSSVNPSSIFNKNIESITNLLSKAFKSFKGCFPSTIKQILQHLKVFSYKNAKNILISSQFQMCSSKLLPPGKKEYTLVLDLDETLVHYQEQGEDAFILIRPGCSDFLECLAEIF